VAISTEQVNSYTRFDLNRSRRFVIQFKQKFPICRSLEESNTTETLRETAVSSAALVDTHKKISRQTNCSEWLADITSPSGCKPPGHNPLVQTGGSEPGGYVRVVYVRQSWNLALKSAMCDSVGFIRPCHWTGDSDLGGGGMSGQHSEQYQHTHTPICRFRVNHRCCWSISKSPFSRQCVGRIRDTSSQLTWKSHSPHTYAGTFWPTLIPARVELSLTSHSTHNRSFRRRVFPGNHLAMVLTKQTYNNQDKHEKPKDIHKKPQKLNLTKPN